MTKEFFSMNQKTPMAVDHAGAGSAAHTARVDSRNGPWQMRSIASVWHPCTQMQRTDAVPPLPMVRGEGPWLFDEDGHRYFDANSSWWVNLFGHSDARIQQAVTHQLHTLPHVMLAGCTHEPAVVLAERLAARTQGVLGHAFFASDGASAIEIALKMSFHYWKNTGKPGKREFVHVRHGYHGETLGALSVTDVAVFRDAYDALLLQGHEVASPDARQAGAGETAVDVARRAAADLEKLLQEQHDRIAAVIVEPLIQCAAGMAMHDPLYLQEVRTLCDQYGVHLIADEIAVGFGRTGTFFACEQAGIWPDFLCLSKGITGGYLPLSLVMTRDTVYAAFLSEDVTRGFLHSHSYTGNALACSAALAVLDHFEKDDVLHRNVRQAEWLDAALASLREDERIQHWRRRGMIWAFDVKPEHARGRFAERVHLAGRRHELLIRPIGSTVYLMPPYLLDEGVCSWLAHALQMTLNDVWESNDADATSEPAVA